MADVALAALDTGKAYAPALWWFEVRNMLIVNERRKRITERASSEFLLDFSRVTVAIDREPVERDVMRLARKHSLTVYDAAYLELALRRQCALATLDSALAHAARAENVRLLVED